MKVIVSPTLGAGSLTALATSGRPAPAHGGAAVLLVVTGSNWSELVIVAVLVCGTASRRSPG